MVLLFQCKYRCVKLNMLKLAPKTEQDSNGTFHQGAFLLPRWPPGHLKAHICFDRCGFFCSLIVFLVLIRSMKFKRLTVIIFFYNQQFPIKGGGICCYASAFFSPWP